VSNNFRNPAEWPPQPGDLWRDSYPRGGHLPRPAELWFATSDTDKGVQFVGLTGHKDDPDRVRHAYGPLTLVHREEASS
jgi:hypothetical protein